MTRTNIIQMFINKMNAKKYLEIGIGSGENYRGVSCEYKISVEPIPNSAGITHIMTSDEFFNQNKETFDVIFIDGLHWSEQVYRDIINSLSVLNSGGVIVCHDMLPPDEGHQIYPQPFTQSNWTGDCWKAWVKLKSERDDLTMRVVDTDYGCGIITVGNQEKIILDSDLTWENFDINKNEWLNLITVDKFIELYA